MTRAEAVMLRDQRHKAVMDAANSGCGLAELRPLLDAYHEACVALKRGHTEDGEVIE